MPPHAGFTITRKPGTDGLVFNPPKGSDELCDALEAAYPDEKTTYQRRRRAIIDFYLHEKFEDDQRSSPASSYSSNQPSTQHSPPSASPSEHYLRTARGDRRYFAASPKEISSTLQLVEMPLKRKCPSTQDEQLKNPALTAPLFNKFRLVDTARPKTKTQKRKTEQQRDAFGNLKSACSIHSGKKKRV
jgi:hypothetical protein